MLRPRADDHTTSHPGAADVRLIVEVAGTTVDYDRNTKDALYGLAGIPEYWLVDLPDAAIEVHRDPTDDGGYHYLRRHRAGDVLHPLAFPELEVPVESILP